jgi:hypothetical protein
VTYVTREQRNAVDVKAGACSAVQNALPLALGSKTTRYLQATAVSSTTYLQVLIHNPATMHKIKEKIAEHKAKKHGDESAYDVSCTSHQKLKLAPWACTK